MLPGRLRSMLETSQWSLTFEVRKRTPTTPETIELPFVAMEPDL